MSGEGRGAGTFAALAVRDFRRIWVATMLYFLAIFAGMIARGWLALELTGTNAGLGAVNMAFGAASLLATPFGGVLADRFDKRKIVLFSTAGLALSSGFLGVAVLAGAVRFWMLLATAAAEAIVFALLVPARMAMSAGLVGPGLLHNAVVLSQISMNANRILGPSLAGGMLAVAWLGPAGVYLTCAAICVVAVVVLWGLPPTVGRSAAPTGPRPSPLASLVDGVRYARRDPLLARLLTISLVVTMFGFSYVTFLPAVAETFFAAGSGGFAALSVISAVGGLAASLVIAGRIGATRGWTVQGVSGLGFGLGVIALGASPSLAVALVVSLVLGAAVAGFQSMNATLVLANADPAYHGRMQSLLQLGFSAFGLAGLPLGLLADAVGLRQTLVGMGLICIVTIAAGQLVSNAHRRAPAGATEPA